MGHLTLTTQFKLDGATIPDGATANRLAPADYSRGQGQGLGITTYLNGNKSQTFRLGGSESRVGPTNVAKRAWSIAADTVDDTAWPTFLRRATRGVNHTFHDKVLDGESFDGNATWTECYLSRQVLGVGYAASAGLGVNAGAAESFRVYNETTGVAYTVVTGGAPGAGQVRLYIAGEGTLTRDPYRRLTFNAAPGNVQGVIWCEGFFLYECSAGIPGISVARNRSGEYLATSITLQELGGAP